MFYEATAPQFDKTLSNLDKWLSKAESYAQSKSFDVQVLLDARLAPDQYPLRRQVQISCDWAKFGCARLSGKTPPVHPDSEQTLAELRQRIATCRSYVQSFKPEDFEGAAERLVPLSFLPGKKAARGIDYLHESALPNFYFHVTTAYAIMRHNGVPLGKVDFIGGLRFQDA